jgi:uncharacterized membrane protein
MHAVSQTATGCGKLAAEGPMDATDDLLFQAVVMPHRSLSPRGLRVLIAAICGSSLLITTLFFIMGAWPIAGFSGVEITLAVLLLRLNAREARRSEVIMLTPGQIRVIRTDVKGRRSERQMDASWLNVVVQERAARVPALLLCSRHAQEEVAREIGEVAKRELADGLAAALYRWRHPVFDNPQLREPQA